MLGLPNHVAYTSINAHLKEIHVTLIATTHWNQVEELVIPIYQRL